MSISLRHAAVLALSSLSLSSFAQTTPDNQWHGALSLGAAAASGNTTAQALTLGAEAAKASAQDKISLYGLANYARSKVAGTTSTTSNLLRLGGRYDYNLTKEWFAFGAGETETNKAAGLSTRNSLGAGVGYHVIATPSTTFDVFGGVGYNQFKYTNGLSRNGASLLLGEESAHKLSETTTFKQRLTYMPGNTGGNGVGNRATFDAGLATAIRGGWTMNLGTSVRYASVVAPGMKTTDALLTAGFGYKY